MTIKEFMTEWGDLYNPEQMERHLSSLIEEEQTNLLRWMWDEEWRRKKECKNTYMKWIGNPHNSLTNGEWEIKSISELIEMYKDGKE
jgi:hypothetical protein